MADDVDRMILQMSADLRRMERSFERGQQKANQTAGRIEGRFNRMNRNLARSGDQLGRVLGRAMGPLLAGATVAGLARITTGALAAAEAIQDMSRRANTSSEFLQELRYVTSQNGAETRDFDDAISRLNRRLGLFLQDGAGPAANAFERLGLTARITSGELRNSEDVFNAAVSAMQGIESQAERSALASQMFGEDSGPRLVQLMSLGTSAMADQRQAARELGVVMSNELVDKAAEASDVLERMNMQFSATVNTAIAENADELIALANALSEVAAWAVEASGNIGSFFQQFERSGGGDFAITPIDTDEVDAQLAAIDRAQQMLANYRAGSEVGGVRMTQIQSAVGRDALEDEGFTMGARSRLDAGELLFLSEMLEMRAADLRAARAALENQTLMRRFNEEVRPGRREGDRGRSSGGTGLDQSTADDSAAREIANLRAREAAESATWLRRYNERINLQRQEIENEIELARLRGDDDEVRRLERQLELQERINGLVSNGVAYRDAQAQAGEHLDAEDLARRQGEYREFFRGAFRDGMLAALDGNAGEALSSWWREYVTRAMSNVLDRLADQVFNLIANMGSGGGGNIMAQAASFAGFFSRGGTMSAGQYGYVGEKGVERAEALPGGGVKITPVGGGPSSGQGQTIIRQELHLHAEGAVMTQELLDAMDEKAATAGRLAYGASRSDLARAAKRRGKRLR
ncbi:hypothetical protein [Maricaulis sp.]|uniref:hypothetical protein n=1 Tax=Maricaulis sp. TaxID=1486257 RepID=UPI000C451E23|nr:hypothetical protein [Maricaulis sp.]MAC89654.1 hypothetical protein [Maricaulis sp.]